MVKRCCHGNCNSDIRYPERLQGGIKFVRFPSPKKNFEKLIRWLSLCGKSYSQVNLDKTRHRFLCTKHFVDKSGPTKEHPDPVQAPPYIPRKERNQLAREAKKSAQSKKGLKAVKSKTVAKDLCVKERHTSAGSSTCSTIQSKTASRDTMPPKKKPGSAQKGAMKKSGSARFQVDLMMECEDEELSPAQLKAMQQAQEDHDKANDLIKAARAGNTLVPSTKPNTFTLVPPKQPLAPPKVPQIAPSLAVPTSKNQSPANSAPASTGLVTKQPAMQQLTPQAPIIQKQLSEPAIQTPSGPPPRPQQYLNKHQQKKEDTSPDIMIIGESPPRPNSKILMNQNVQQHQIPAQSAKVTGVTPTQVYKFVSPHGTTTQIGNGAQWLIRPVLTVTPQQLQQQQGKQQIQQPAATSGNKVYFTTPPRGTNTKPGLHLQEHSIMGLMDWLATRAEYTGNIPYEEWILLEEKIYCDELLAFNHYHYSKLEEYTVRKRGELLKYYLDRYFQEKRKLELKLQMDAFFSNKSDMICSLGNVACPNKADKKYISNGPMTYFKSHSSDNKECVLSDDKICDKNLIAKSAFMSNLLTSGYKVEPALICDKHAIVACRYMHNQQNLRKINCNLFPQNKWNNHKRLNIKHCVKVKSAFFCARKYKNGCNLIASRTCGHFKTDANDTFWIKKRNHSLFDNCGETGRLTCWNCVLISHYKDLLNSTAFIRPLSGSQFVYPLYDFKGTSKELNQIGREGGLGLGIENEQNMLLKARKETSNTSDMESDHDQEMVNVSEQKKDVSQEGQKIDGINASDPTSYFYASLNGDLPLSDNVNLEREQGTFNINGIESFPSNCSHFEKNRREDFRESNMESSLSEELQGRFKQIMLCSKSNPWYKDISDFEIRNVLNLCQHIGWTNVAKILHIPKMQLFTWNREFRKLKPTEITIDVTNSSLSAKNADTNTLADNDPATNNNSKCLEKSSQNCDAGCIEDGSLQRDEQTSSDSQRSNHSTIDTNKGWENTAFKENCNTDGRLHPPTSIQVNIERRRKEFGQQNIEGSDVSLDNTGKKKMPQETMFKGSELKHSTSDSLTSIIGRLRSKLSTQTSENLKQSLTGGHFVGNIQDKADSNSSSDESSGDLHALVIDTSGSGRSSAQDTDKDSEIDESKEDNDFDLGNPKNKDKSNSDQGMGKIDIENKEPIVRSRAEETVQESAAKAATKKTVEPLSGITSSNFRKDSDKVSDICPMDHCYLGNSSNSLSQNEKEGTVSDSVFEDGKEKEYVWKPVDDGKLAFPQNEWFTLNGRKIRVFSTFTDHKRQQLKKRIEKRGITQVSTKLKIPEEYLQTVVHTNAIDQSKLRSQSTVKQLPKMPGRFVSLSGVIDEMYSGQMSLINKSGSGKSDNKLQEENNKASEHIGHVFDSAIQVSHVGSGDFEGKNNQSSLTPEADQSAEVTYGCTGHSKTHPRIRNISQNHKEMVVRKSYEIGRKEACKIFKLNTKTLTHWRNECLMHADLDGNSAKTKEPVLKRVVFPTGLKMKLAFLSLEHGISKVCKQYNITQKSVKSWIEMFRGKTLSTSEFTEDELKILIAHNEAKALAGNRRNQLRQLAKDFEAPAQLTNSIYDKTETSDSSQKSNMVGSNLPGTSLSSGDIGQIEKTIEQSDIFEEICSWQIQTNAQRPPEDLPSASVHRIDPKFLNSEKTIVFVKEDTSGPRRLLAQSNQHQVLNQDKVQNSTQFANSDISVVSAYYGVGNQAASAKLADKKAVERSLVKPKAQQVQHIKKEFVDSGFGEAPNQDSQGNNMQQSEVLFSTQTPISSYNFDSSTHTPVSIRCEMLGTQVADRMTNSFPASVQSSSHDNALRLSREDTALNGTLNIVGNGNSLSTGSAHLSTPLLSSKPTQVQVSLIETSPSHLIVHLPGHGMQKITSNVGKNVDASENDRSIHLKDQHAMTLLPVNTEIAETVTQDADASPQTHETEKVKNQKSNYAQPSVTGQSLSIRNDLAWKKRSERLAGVISDRDIEIEKSIQSVLMSLRGKRKKQGGEKNQQGPDKEGQTCMNLNTVADFKARKQKEFGESSSESANKQTNTGRITLLINKISDRLQDADKSVEDRESKKHEIDDESSTDTASLSESNGSSEKKEFTKDMASDKTPNISEKLKSLLDADIFRNIEDDEKLKERDADRAPSPNLSEKLQSLLNADIFSNIDEKSGNENDIKGTQSLITTSSKKENKSKIKSDEEVKENPCEFDISKTRPENGENVQKKLFYSLGLKVKLAHLCNVYSCSDISKKYNISINSLRKWKKMYQNCEEKNFEFTQDELLELKCIKEKMSPADFSAEQYDIYIDNPESDLDCVLLENSPSKAESSSAEQIISERKEESSNQWKSVSEKMNLKEVSESGKNSVPSKDKTKDEIVIVLDNLNSPRKEKPHPTRVPNIISKRSTAKPPRKSNPLVENDVPLYFVLDETVSDETKKQIREKVVKPSTNWPKGVFLESAATLDSFSSEREHSLSSSASGGIFSPSAQTASGDSGENSGKDLAKPITFASSSDEEGSCLPGHRRKYDDGNSVKNSINLKNLNSGIGTIGSKQSDLFKSIFEETNNMIAELNSQLSPNGLQSNSTMSSKDIEVNVGKDLTDLTNTSKSIRYSDLKSHFIQKGHTVEGITIAHESQKISEVDGVMAEKKSVSPKSVHVTLRRTLSTESTAPVSVSAKRSLSLDNANDENFDRIEKEDSFLWKWKKVREARISGFENTAKLHKINMTDIMKWHDDFVKDEELKLKLASAQHALLYGLHDAANYYNVSTKFITELFKKERKSVPDTDSTVTATTPVEELPSAKKGRRKGLEFETVEREDGKIKRPKFQKSKETTNVGAISDDLRKTQKTRMGPNSINYTPSSRELLRVSEITGEGFNKDAYIADTRADLGTMPRVVKQSHSGTGDVEIASTWKQIQSVIHPQKQPEKKYTQEFRNRIIKECEEKGQKVVSRDHRIPYNEISRWRLEAKKAILSKYKPAETLKAQDKLNQNRQLNNQAKSDGTLKGASTQGVGEVSQVTNSVPRHITEASSVLENNSEKKSSKNKESLKIKIKLSKNPEVVQRTSKEEKLLDIPAFQEQTNTDNIVGTEYGHKVHDEDAEKKLQVVNYCIQFGVLKTQKKFGLIRQSIVDLMQEYDDYCKTAFNYNTRSQDVMNFHTKLVTRDKTSVEESVSHKPPVIMHNLKDYIVTQEYKDSVAEYAREHGITAATRKFKRKPSTVKSWMGHYAQRLRKIRKVEELMKQAQAEFGIKGNETEHVRLPQTAFGNREYETEQNTENSTLTWTKSPKTPDSSEQTSVWVQDFVIKPSSGNSPLKMTLSPRRTVVTLSTDEEQKETDSDGEGDATEEYEEVTNMEDTEEPESMNDKNILYESNNKVDSNSTVGEDHHKEITVSKVDDTKVTGTRKDTGSNASKEREHDVLISPTDIPNILEISELFSEGLDESKSDENDKSKTESDGRVDRPSWILEEKSSVDLVTEGKTDEEKLKLDTKGKGTNSVDQTVESLTEVLSPSQNLLSGEQNSLNRNVERTVNEKNEKAVADKLDNVGSSGEIKDAAKENEQMEEKQSESIVPNAEVESVIPSNEKELAEKKVPEVKQVPVVEEVQEVIPYEDSLMFKLYTSDVDLFFSTTKSVTGKSFQNDKSESFFDETVSELHSVRRKNNTTKEPTLGADSEILNKEVICQLYSSSISRQDIKDQSSSSNYIDTSVTVHEGPNNRKETCNMEDDGNLLREKQTNSKAEQYSKEAGKDIDSEGPDQSDEVEKERSLFDFFSFGKDEIPDEKEKANTASEPKNSTTELTKEKTDAKGSEKIDSNTLVDKAVKEAGRETSAFSLFGNLIKSFKIPKTFPVKKEEVSITKPLKDPPEPLIMKPDDNLNKKEVTEMKRVEIKSERNLFDFILPSPARESELNTTPETSGTGIVELEAKKLQKSESILPLGRINPVKSIFKFNKVPVNFGNIAKLGMAQLKKDDIKMKADDSATHFNTTGDKEESKKEMDNTHSSSKDTKVQNVGKNDNSLELPKPGVIMETFEELRRRLAQERAANKLEKERKTNLDNSEIQSTKQEPDKEKPDVLDVYEKIDCDSYKEFPAQKVTLIVDIAKKHGIEFASSSFGLPPMVIVNWIIEKDRKHRRITAGTTLETKLIVVGEMIRGKEEDLDELAQQHKVNVEEMLIWKRDFQWLMIRKDVQEVVDRWMNVESMQSLENPTRKTRGSISEKMDSEKGVSVDEVDGGKMEQNMDEQNLEKLRVSEEETEKPEETKPVVDQNIIQSKDSQAEGKLPDVLSFTLLLNPRDYSLEQKAMIVLLVDKFGIKEVHNKLGINKGTLWTWKNQNRFIKQLLHEQRTGVRITKVVLGSEKMAQGNKSVHKENKNTMLDSETFEKVPGTLPEEDVDNQPLQHKGYRLISPTKIPPILRNARNIPTKDFTFEQRVAIVQLVELYGVRTIHKQFRIPQGSIWNWQHSKSITQELKKDGENDVVETARRNLQFGTQEDLDTDPLTIDTILDRVLITVETTNHLNFNSSQKSDVVCLIDHFGLQYVCDKLPQIPRGTLWNWNHNKHVRTSVEKKMAVIQRSLGKTMSSSTSKEAVDINDKKPLPEYNTNDKPKSAGSSIKEPKYSSSPNKDQEGPAIELSDKITEEIQATVSEVVDKAAMTQNWVSACQQDTALKRKAEFSGRQTWNSGGHGVKAPCIRPERNNDWQTNVGLDGVCSEKDFFRSLGHGSVVGSSSVKSKDQHGSRTRASSISSISSTVSDQTSEFEEILSEDELNTSSNYSKISGRDSVTATNSEVVKTSLIPQLKWSFLSAFPVDTENANLEQSLEILQIEEGSHSRLMVSFKIVNDEDESAAAKKKSKKDSLVEIDSAGHWVPLDEYYYGTVDGDATYNEDKGEYRFKCWYCSKMLYNNVRAMQHIQAHIDSTKQLNIDLSDLTQCKHCYKQFDTPFEMQTHVEKVHLSNKVLMCRICEKDFGNTKDLIMHMRQSHLPCEMPYHCQLCGFRSSMYSDVVDHFKKKHDSSSNMLCLYCLRVFRIKFVSQGWGQTQTYYGHLLKHQAKSSMKKCNVCRLMFFNPLDVKNHRKNCHTSYKMDFKAMSMGQAADDQLMIKVTEGSPKGSGGPKKESKPKSLNAPSISKIQDYGGVSLPFATTTSRCIECKMTMSSTDHYKKHINCSLCRFATSCSVAYANHMMGFHSGQVTSLNLNIPWERPMKQIMFCSCGFSTKYGTKMANHLVFCGKHTCSGERPNIADTAGEKAKDEGKKEGGIFGALGLVQKKTVTTRVRTLDSGKSEPKSEWKMEKQSGQESKLTSLKQKTSPSPPVIAVDDFKSSILYVSKSKLDTGKDGQGDQQNVKEDTEHLEKGAIEGNKNDAGNQLGINDKGDSTDVKKENSYKQDKVQAADVTIEESGKQNVEASEIKEESDELLNKDKLAEKADTALHKNEDEKSVDEHDEAQSTQQTVPEAIQLDSDAEEDNVKAKRLEDKPEGTEMIDIEGKHPSDKSDDNAEESDAQEAKKLDNDTEEDNVAKEPLDKANGKKETDSETKQLSVETVEQIEDEIILLEEDMDKGDETSTLNTETQKTSEDITDEEMADKIPATMDESEHTETGDRTSHTEDTELMETDQVDEKENSVDEQQSTKEGNAAESGAFSTETEDVEMKDTADKEQEEPKESEEVSQVKQTDPDMSVRSDVDNCRDVGEQQGDITAETETVTPTDVEVTEESKDVATEDHPDKSEAKTGDSEEDSDVNKPDETKQETSQIERPRQSSVDSQKSDRSDRSSQGQQDHRSHSSGGHAYDERYRHGDRSHDRSHDRHQRDYHSGTQRSDDYRPYNRDRDRSHDRGYDEGRRDNRYGYDNRGGHGQSYRGHGGHRGQYGGHHYGNRGGYNQDRNYNRNYGNRGGYGGGYRGGYY